MKQLNPQLSRRQFVAQTGAWTSVLGALHAVPARAGTATSPGAEESSTGPSAPPTLVVVYLRGGIDPLGVMTPYKDAWTAQHRPTLALPAPDAKDNPHAAIPLDGTFALNPALAALVPLYRAGRMAPVICVGSHHPTRSHFDAQDFMERAAPGLRHITQGWLNRYLSATATSDEPPLRAVAMQPRLPSALRGQYPVLAVPDMNLASGAIDAVAALYPGEPSGPVTHKSAPPNTSATEHAMRQRIRRVGEQTIAQLQHLNHLMTSTEIEPTRDYPRTGFADQLQRIARLIKSGSGLEIAAVDYNGWDHHVDEGPIDGNMAHHLRRVGDGVAAFAADLGPRFDRVMVLLMSEFGRTVRENGNAGTDHGHGGVMLAVGGMVEGGRVFGRWTGLEPRHLYQQRDLPVHTDFRTVFSQTLDHLFGFDGVREGLFPQFTPTNPPLDFLRRVT